MKKIKLLSLFLSFVVTSLNSTHALSHVVPEDQLRNQVYLTTRQALQKVFAGVNTIKKEKRKLTATQQARLEKLLQRKIEDLRFTFFTANKDGQKLYATVGKTFANSHPVTKSTFIILMNSQGQAKEVHIMEYRGPQRAEIISRPFLDQFNGKTAESDFTTVTSNQGPTPSVQALSQEVHEILALYKVLYLGSSN